MDELEPYVEPLSYEDMYWFTSDDTREYLENRVSYLEERCEALQARLDALESVTLTDSMNDAWYS